MEPEAPSPPIDAAQRPKGASRVEKEWRCVVQADEGQETLTPEEFAERYGWENDPGKVSMG